VETSESEIAAKSVHFLLFTLVYCWQQQKQTITIQRCALLGSVTLCHNWLTPTYWRL